MTDLCKPLKLELPFPPSVNHYGGERVVYSKKHRKHIVTKFIAERGKAFRREVMDECMVQGALKMQIAGPLQYELWLYPPANWAKWDIDNYRKALLDALGSSYDKQGGLITAGVVLDDSQFEHDEGWKMPKVAGGRTIIEIKPFSNPHSAHNQIDLLAG